MALTDGVDMARIYWFGGNVFLLATGYWLLATSYLE